jgi:prephenate dehydrogenase
MVLVAVPVAATETTLKAIKHMVTPDMLIMDVGSTKADVMDAARRALKEQIGSFVPAHPIAGKEQSGIDHADADLYRGCKVILTPTERTLTTQLKQAQQLWSEMGCDVVQMSPESHDAAFAAVSHLPHLLAFALMNSIHGQPQGESVLALAGPGFRDFTRIAASDPLVWRDIFLANRHELSVQIQHFQTQLQAFEALMTSKDVKAIEAMIRQASTARTQWQLPQATKPC